MRPPRSLSLIYSILAGTVAAGEITNWMTTTCWETSWAEKAPVTFWSTSTCTETRWWSTVQYSTLWSIATVTQTETDIQTETKTETETDVVTQTKTEVETDVVTQTKTDIETDIVTQTKTETERDFVTVTKVDTETETDVETKLETYIETGTETEMLTYVQSVTISRDITNTATAILVSTSTVYDVQTATITSISEIPTTVYVYQTTISTVTNTVLTTVSPPSSASSTISLTGLVPCPSRVINPTYTTTVALPDNYEWGCPPGTLCKPPRIDCNFESNLPADSYYCSPDECEPVASLPPLNQIGGPYYDLTNDTCALYEPIDDYFNLDPHYFGLDFNIFQFGDRKDHLCSGNPVTQISDGQIQAPATVIPVTQISDGQPQAPTVTARAVLDERDNLILPAHCYRFCNAPLVVAQSCGFDSGKLCPTQNDFSAGLFDCDQCIKASKTDKPTGPAQIILTALNPYLNYCAKAKQVITTSPAQLTDTATAISPPPVTTTSVSSATSSTLSVSETVSTARSSQPAATTTAITTTTTSTSSIATYSGNNARVLAIPNNSLWVLILSILSAVGV